MTLAFYQEVTRRLRAGETVAVATVIDRQGSAPRSAGARMIVVETGEITFSIGGGAFEALVIEDARDALRTGKGFEKDYHFKEKGDHATGMVCGGTVRVRVEVVKPPEPLYIFGAGHVGRELARIAAGLEFRVIIVDDRERELVPERFPPGALLLRVGREFAAGLPEIPAGAYVAVVTRCHKTDLAAVRHAAGRGAVYLGLIGSRRKVATVVERAVALGTPRDHMALLRAPIGLPIAAETPQEIAVSIAAEMIAVRRGAAATELMRSFTPFPRAGARRRAPGAAGTAGDPGP